MQWSSVAVCAACLLVPAVQLTLEAKGSPTAARRAGAAIEYLIPDPCGGQNCMAASPGNSEKVVLVRQEITGIPGSTTDFEVRVQYSITCQTADCDTTVALADSSQIWMISIDNGQSGFWYGHYGANKYNMNPGDHWNPDQAEDASIAPGTTAAGTPFEVTLTFKFAGGVCSLFGEKSSGTGVNALTYSQSGENPVSSDQLVVYLINNQVAENWIVTDLKISVPAWAPTAAPTASPTPAPPTPASVAGTPASAPASAKGDPHLQNINGQRFDLMRPGRHVLLHIPRGAVALHILLRVEAEVQRLGSQCEDMYFQHVNITGAWVEAKHAGIFQFHAGGIGGEEEPTWMAFGPVQLKVVRAHRQGINYLNFYAKHLGQTGFTVGGLLGEDDHTDQATPDQDCIPKVNLYGTDSTLPNMHPGSSAEASLA